MQLSLVLSSLDAFISLGTLAVEQRLTKPEITEDTAILIKGIFIDSCLNVLTCGLLTKSILIACIYIFFDLIRYYFLYFIVFHRWAAPAAGVDRG